MDHDRVRQLLKTVVVVIMAVVGILGASKSRAEDAEAAMIKSGYKGFMPAGLWRLGDGVLFPPYAIVVDKSKKKIHLIDNSTGQPSVLESYDSDLGKLPGDKASSGDNRTPEGIYFLQKLLEGPGLDPIKYGVKAFTTDYPNIFDLRKGKTGYGIWLHAIDEKQTLERGSQGCVVVRNDTIKKLAQNITLRETPLMIFDKVQWVPFDEAKKEAEPVLNAVADWRKAWESKNIDDYMNFYSNDFRFGKMNRETFRRFKTELAQKYENIKVTISMPVIYAHKDTLVVRFYQDYQSSEHTDFGEKTLYILKTDKGYQILNETWQESTNPKARSYIASGTNLCCQTSN
jgi:murein L,D-transpeptidase YafK